MFLSGRGYKVKTLQSIFHELSKPLESVVFKMTDIEVFIFCTNVLGLVNLRKFTSKTKSKFKKYYV